MTKEVEIEVTYVGDQPLLSILESNVDLDKVSFRRNPLFVKAVFPISLIITTTAFYLFEKFVLDPVLDPLAEKYNWFIATKKHLRPHQPVNIKVQLDGNDFIVASLGLDHESVANVWKYIREALDISRAEGIFDDISQIRITSTSPGNPKVILYQGSKPWRIMNLKEKRSTIIPQ